MSTRSAGDVLLTLIIGGIAGVVLGVLYAPASGKETRKKITGMENDLEDMVSKGKEKILQHKHHIEETVHAAGKEIRNAGRYIENI